jgi:hypothetical protein
MSSTSVNFLFRQIFLENPDGALEKAKASQFYAERTFHGHPAKDTHAWANAAVTIPAMMYWSSGEAPEASRWVPFDPSRGLLRLLPWLRERSTTVQSTSAHVTRPPSQGPDSATIHVAGRHT